MTRGAHLPAAGFSAKLSHGLDHAERAACGAGLSGRQLSSAGVDGERAVYREVGFREKPSSLALAAEPEVFELHESDDRIIVVHLHEVHVPRAQPGLLVHRITNGVPAADELNGLAVTEIMSFTAASNVDWRALERAGAIGRCQHHRVSAAARQNAIVQSQWIDDEARRQIIIERQRLAN